MLIADKLKQAFASMAIAASVITVITPVLGGWLTTNSSWQYLFWPGQPVFNALLGDWF